MGKSNLELYLDEVRPNWDPSIERGIIGCMLVYNKCVPSSIMLLPEMFVDEKNREFFVCIQTLYSQGSPVNDDTITAYFLQRNNNLSSINMADYKCEVPTIGCFDFLVCILRQRFIQSQFYKLMGLAPLVLGNKANLDNFIPMAISTLIPLNKTLFANFDKPSYIPHWLTNGNTIYKVYEDKFKPGKGYVWVDGKATPEEVLMACGFERTFIKPQ